MRSVLEADWGSRAGSPRGVVVATGLVRGANDSVKPEGVSPRIKITNKQLSPRGGRYPYHNPERQRGVQHHNTNQSIDMIVSLCLGAVVLSAGFEYFNGGSWGSACSPPPRLYADTRFAR